MSDIEKLSTPETDTKTIDNKIQTFADTIHGEKKNLERNLEKKLGGGSGRWAVRNIHSDETKYKSVNNEETNSSQYDNLNKKKFENVETPDMEKNPTTMATSGGQNDKLNNVLNLNEFGGESSKSSNKDVDDNNKMKEEKWSKMSSMEEEALRERTRATLLKQCSAYLAADGSSRYTRETFRRVFTEKVSLFKINRLKIPMMT